MSGIASGISQVTHEYEYIFIGVQYTLRAHMQMTLPLQMSV